MYMYECHGLCPHLMTLYVQRTVAGCCAALRQIRNVCRSLPSIALQSLVVSPVLRRLNYDNAKLAGIPVAQLARLVTGLLYTLGAHQHIRCFWSGVDFQVLWRDNGNG